MEIRQVRLNDAENFVRVIKQVENEAHYMLFEAGERNISIDKQTKIIESILKEDNSTIFIAEEEKEIVGYLMVFGGKAKRNKHASYLVVGIVQSHRGKGLGTKLFMALNKWAINHKIHRLELTVVTQNEAGLGLYKKMGFEIEGTKRHSLFIDGKFVDEYYMSKLL
jgi:RimJ/RimL family protein N-acetyltransferase